MKTQTTDLEMKAIDSDLLIYFEILCKKADTNLRKELIDYMMKKVNEALKEDQITIEDKNSYEFETEEY